MLQRTLLCALLTVAPAAATAAEDQASPPASVEAGTGSRWSTTATAREEWRGRIATGPEGLSESDHTARVFLDADARSASEAVTLGGSLGLWWRFEESYGGEDGRPLGLASPRDRFHLDVYSLYARWMPGTVLRSIAAGRQEAAYGLPGAFDGLSLTLRPAPMLDVFAFGGRSVHFFEVDPDLFENWLASAGVALRGDWWRLEADYRFMAEDVATFPADPTQSSKSDPTTKVSLTNHGYGLAAWLRHGDWLNAKVQVRGLDDQLQLVGGAVHAEWLAQELGVDARLDVQPSTLRELNEFDSPFFLTLGESRPHLKARVDLFKNFTTPAGLYGIHLGGDARQLIDAEESAFNRNLLRGYLLLSAQKIAGTGLYLSALGEINRIPNPASGTDEALWAVGGALGFDKKPFKAEVGSAFHRYDYVYYQSPEERADVREFYGDVKVKVLDWLALRGRYSYEVFDRTIHTVTVSLTEAY